MENLTNTYMRLTAALFALGGWTYSYRMVGMGTTEVVASHPIFGEYVVGP
jgi:hypothetical protein